MRIHHLIFAVPAALALACGSSSPPPSNVCDPSAQTPCSNGLVCEQVQGDQPGCFAPLVVRGRTFDLANADPTTNGVAGARVVALDANHAPLSPVAISEDGTTGDPKGTYKLQVPWQRQADGTPVAGHISLRADAVDYQTFPSGLRVALPIDVSTAVKGTSSWTLQSAQTDIGLIKLPNTTNLAQIHGTVASVPNHEGVLVVAESSGVGVTGITDASGSYAIFNLGASTTSPGTAYTVTAYAQSANYVPVQVNLMPGDDKQVDFSLANATTATVTGNLDFGGQNMPANPSTSVALVVKSTFVENLGRGEQPPGLSASGVTPAATGYSIPGVPDGTYIVLAAFGNDGMVRDISGIGGSAPVEVDVSGGAVTLAPGAFKLTGAMTLGTPFVAPYDTTPWPVTSGVTQPVFDWVAYASASQGYIVQVFDTFGAPLLPQNAQASPLTLKGVQVAASPSPSYTYPGAPALQKGMYYQFKVFAMQTISAKTVVASQSKDQQGVFYMP